MNDSDQIEERQRKRSAFIQEQYSQIEDSIPPDHQTQIYGVLLDALIIFLGGLGGVALAKISRGYWIPITLLFISLEAIIFCKHRKFSFQWQRKYGLWLRAHRRKAVVLFLFLLLCAISAIGSRWVG